MRFLKTNTATRITVGPFLDKTDGITPEVALTVTNEKLTLVVDDGGAPTLVLDSAPTVSGGANDMVHVNNDDAGFYEVELTAANVNYLGRAMLALTDAANHCPVFHELMILPAEVYDALILGSGNITTVLTTAYEKAKDDVLTPVTAIKAKTDALPADPADESLLQASITSLAGQVTLVAESVAELAEASGEVAGSGAITWPYMLLDTLGNPISGAQVWVTTDIQGTNVIASGTTDASGIVTFYLDAGTVYIFAHKSGYNFTNPDTEVVS